jgi:hypothetical protein
VERARRDEENVVGTNHAVACVNGSAFDDGQNVTLHTFARDVRSMTAFPPCNLVDLVEKDDAGILDALDGYALTFIFRFLVRWPKMLGNMSFMLTSISSTP